MYCQFQTHVTSVQSALTWSVLIILKVPWLKLDLLNIYPHISANLSDLPPFLPEMYA